MWWRATEDERETKVSQQPREENKIVRELTSRSRLASVMVSDWREIKPLLCFFAPILSSSAPSASCIMPPVCFCTGRVRGGSQPAKEGEVEIHSER